jgi:tetratricopeptide (TPR) repeat protein
MPKNIITAASMYQEGMELKEGRNYIKANQLFKMCLQKDPLYIDAFAALTELYYRSVQYDSALYYANKALQLDTYHPAANYFAGITYRAKGDLTDAIESLGWAARSTEYRSVAYVQMAEVEFLLNNKELTEHYATLSLDFNRTNLNALHLLSILYRKSGEVSKAEKYLKTLKEIDPLSHFANFEQLLINPSDENLKLFTSAITNEMPYQTFLELCMLYYGLGLKNDALSVIGNAPSHPLISLWKAYLNDDASMLNEVVVASPEFVFPYRTETVSALKWAVSKNNNWKFKYYLALNYYAVQRTEDAMNMFRNCRQEPDFAPFYLTRASLLTPGNDGQDLQDLNTAQALAPDDWRTAYMLIRYYNRNKDYKMALSLSASAYKKHKDNSVLGLQYSIALINNNQYAAGIKILEGMNILPFEGASEGKIVYEQACLFLSLDLVNKKRYKEAIKMIEKSKEWPENLGVGKPYVADTRIQDYLNIICLERLNQKDDIETFKQSILDYTRQHNAPSFNTLLALKILNEIGEADVADNIVRRLEESSNPVMLWVAATYRNDEPTIRETEKEFTSNTNFMIMKRLLEVPVK